MTGHIKCKRIEKGPAGFTLLEILVAMAILSIVLGICYQILGSTLKASQHIDRRIRPDKVGEGIMAVLRRDLQGAVAHRLGDTVFLGENRGQGEGARDELHFFTSTRPVFSQTQVYGDNWWTGVTSVSYILEASETGGDSYTLFRRESKNITDRGEPFSQGTYFEIYDKVKYLDIQYFDGIEWSNDWDSVLRREAYQQELQAAIDDLVAQSGKVRMRTEEEGRTGTGGAVLPGRSASSSSGSGESQQGSSIENELPLPENGLPRAVRIELGIAVGGEYGLYRKGVERDAAAEIYRYSATVTIPSSQVSRISREVCDAFSAAGSKAGGVTRGSGGGTRTFGGIITRQGRQPPGSGERGSGARGRRAETRRPGSGARGGGGRSAPRARRSGGPSGRPGGR